MPDRQLALVTTTPQYCFDETSAAPHVREVDTSGEMQQRGLRDGGDGLVIATVFQVRAGCDRFRPELAAEHSLHGMTLENLTGLLTLENVTALLVVATLALVVATWRLVNAGCYLGASSAANRGRISGDNNWTTVSPYMGLFERVSSLVEKGLLKRERVVVFYGYRVGLLVDQINVSEWLIGYAGRRNCIESLCRCLTAPVHRRGGVPGGRPGVTNKTHSVGSSGALKGRDRAAGQPYPASTILQLYATDS